MRFITPIVVMLLQVSPVVAQPVRVTGTSVALDRQQCRVGAEITSRAH
jgi:hypothetical protein